MGFVGEAVLLSIIPVSIAHKAWLARCISRDERHASLALALFMVPEVALLVLAFQLGFPHG